MIVQGILGVKYQFCYYPTIFLLSPNYFAAANRIILKLMWNFRGFVKELECERRMTSYPQETDDELLLSIRSGDEEAFITLYHRRQGALYRFALHMSGSAAVAEDVIQEVFLTVLRANCGYDPE